VGVGVGVSLGVGLGLVVVGGFGADGLGVWVGVGVAAGLDVNEPEEVEPEVDELATSVVPAEADGRLRGLATAAAVTGVSPSSVLSGPLLPGMLGMAHP
jgi:hypothetical protein